jgi:hypothetical protein
MLVQHSRSLPNRQPDLGSMFDGLREQIARLIEILAYVEQTIDFRPVFSSTSLACRYSGHLRTTNCRSLRLNYISHDVPRSWMS